MFFQKSGIGFCYGLIACFVHALQVLVVPRMPCNFASLARCLAFCIHSKPSSYISLPQTLYAIFFLEDSLTFLEGLASYCLWCGPVQFIKSFLINFVLHRVPFVPEFGLKLWLPYFFSSEANCLLISLINNNNNNNNNNNESLFHQKIKLHILCYNNMEDKKLW